MFTCPHCKCRCLDGVDLQGHVAAYHPASTCKLCGNSYRPDQLVLSEKNIDTAFCKVSGLYHDFGEAEN